MYLSMMELLNVLTAKPCGAHLLGLLKTHRTGVWMLSALKAVKGEL